MTSLTSARGGSRPSPGRQARPAALARDFRQPRRLGPERLRELERTLGNALPALERRLAENLGLRAGLALARLGEVDAESLFAAGEAPPCVLRGRIGSEPAWLVWSSSALVGAVEALLGGQQQAVARKLTPTETKVATGLLSEIARAISAALGLSAVDLAFVQSAAELGSWREGGEGAERHRLDVELALTRGADASTLHLYLPGIAAGEAETPELPARLPAHLEEVEIELSARLAGCNLTLDQLLALEEGDVIPLGARLGDATTLCVDGLGVAQARIGSHLGRLAVRIERVEVRAEAEG